MGIDRYADNLRLAEIEYRTRQSSLESLPRCLGVVIGNACNIRCPHCYQAKNGDSLLRPAEIAADLRHELMSFYPYLSTLRLMGGEVFAIRGFSELLDDVATTTNRPIVSISTNGTLITDEWAERIVRTPFLSVTVSIDGGSKETYARMRRGADLDSVLANVQRIRHWKAKLRSELPVVDSFFVVMRSNFREIPRYFDLMKENGFAAVTLELVQISAENVVREPNLERAERIQDAAEVRELHDLLKEAVPRARLNFRNVRFSGLTALFERHGLDYSFLVESANGPYPDSDQLASKTPTPGFELCPNPWTTMFVTENGGVHICFLSEPIGNLYETPLLDLWNCPAAIAKRRQMMKGRYADAGCSRPLCSWREGQASSDAEAPSTAELLDEIRALRARRIELRDDGVFEEPAHGLNAVRRMLVESKRRNSELESMPLEYEALVERLTKEYDGLLDGGRRHIAAMEEKAEKAVSDLERVQGEFERYRRNVIVRAAHRFATMFEK